MWAKGRGHGAAEKATFFCMKAWTMELPIAFSFRSHAASVFCFIVGFSTFSREIASITTTTEEHRALMSFARLAVSRASRRQSRSKASFPWPQTRSKQKVSAQDGSSITRKTRHWHPVRGLQLLRQLCQMVDLHLPEKPKSQDSALHPMKHLTKINYKH